MKNDIINLVEYIRPVEETDFLENGDVDHIVHSVRRLWSESHGLRSTTNEESNRMTEVEYDLYARRKCSYQTSYGTGASSYCGERVYRVRTGTFMERAHCREHLEEG